MKRIILTGLCAAFSFGLFAQKSLIIHMKDGTKKEIPMVAIDGFDFSGKAIVNDGDYTDISNSALHSDTQLNITFKANFHAEDPAIVAMYEPVYGEDWGILYGTTPEVTIENGTLIELSDNQLKNFHYLSYQSVEVAFGEAKTFNGISNKVPVDLDFETSYYFRTFVRKPADSYQDELYYYSKELHINTGKPYMRYYGVKGDTAPYAETGYVMPTNEAWEALKEQNPHFVGGKVDSLMAIWQQYLTPERIAQLKPQCTTAYDCSDGKLYLLDAIGDDFAEFAIDLLNDAFVMTGYVPETGYTQSTQTYMECDEKWNVPNNEYWEYRPSSPTGNPRLTYVFPQSLLGNYNYKVEITLAPNTELTDEELAKAKPNKFSISYYCIGADGRKSKKTEIAKKIEVDTREVITLTYDSVTALGFGQAELEIKGEIGARETKYDRVIRIAQIKVTPIGPVE